jgi:hypothetical protein
MFVYLLGVCGGGVYVVGNDIAFFSNGNRAAARRQHNRLRAGFARGVAEHARAIDVQLVHVARLVLFTRHFSSQVINLGYAFNRARYVISDRD